MTKTLLAPIDLADRQNAKHVLDTAVEQTRAMDAELTVMTVVPDMSTGIDYRYAIRGAAAGSIDYDKKRVLDDVLAALNTFVGDTLPDGMSVRTIVRHGTVYQQVLDVAAEIRADQIVIGAQKQGISDFLLGSNAAIIVRHAKCSVSVVR